MKEPTIAITMGDPAGVGPEVLAKALCDPAIVNRARWIIVGDRHFIQGEFDPARVEVLDQNLLKPSEIRPGQLSAACGAAAMEYVRVATRLCLEGKVDAMVTAPLNKEAVSLSGEKFSGHTEFIAGLCSATDSRMLLVSERLRVVHVTTHIPLLKACDLDPVRIRRTIELGAHAMQLLGFATPRIAVCGLNPHAGENGLFGHEDAQFIAPAVHEARNAGICCEGPIPSDTVFLKAVRGSYDLVVAMYHDQGHVPMKLLDFEQTVNVSLGLPIIRTSVDHGTAFDIAGKGVADPGSMKAAMRLAAVMAENKARRKH